MELRSVLPAKERGRVMDRLVGLEEVIAPALIEQALREEGKVNPRRCPLSYEVLLWLVLAMGVYTDKPLRGVYRCCRRFRADEKRPTRSALCQGRRRLGAQAVRRLFLLMVAALAVPEVPGGFYEGYRLVGLDGSVFNLPDTLANERAFGRPQGGSGPESQGAFPQVGKLSLVEVGTHIELAITIRPLSRGEASLAPRLFGHLTPEMLLLMDAGFYGYPLLKRVFATGAQVLARVPGTPRLDRRVELADGSYLARIYPSPNDRLRDRHGITVRVIRYTLEDPQRVGHGTVHRLVTTLLDPVEHPAKTLIALYHQRWEHELVFDEQKTHQDPRRAAKPTHLRSRTPAGVVQELFALSIAHYATRKIMFEAASREGLDPDRLSFTGTIHILRTRLPECPTPECPTHSAEGIGRWYEGLLSEVAEERLPPRRNRINPRVIKQPRQKWPAKKTEHYRLPPLTKIFEQAVVMLN